MQRGPPPTERVDGHRGVGGQGEIDVRFDTLLRMADKLMLFKYIIKNTAWHALQRAYTPSAGTLRGSTGNEVEHAEH